MIAFCFQLQDFKNETRHSGSQPGFFLEGLESKLEVFSVREMSPAEGTLNKLLHPPDAGLFKKIFGKIALF